MKPITQFSVPPKGWIRAIRDALGMSAVQLGKQLRVKPQSVGDIELSEARGTLQLKTLRRFAEVMDCTLVQALVSNASLEDMAQERARTVARGAVACIDHSMDLEAQIEAYIRDHLKERDLWDEP